jgi:hypothetical protein
MKYKITKPLPSRHVRVHHVNISKDDPELREVLRQRPTGPSRGRRRRAHAPGPSGSSELAMPDHLFDPLPRSV